MDGGGERTPGSGEVTEPLRMVRMGLRFWGGSGWSRDPPAKSHGRKLCPTSTAGAAAKCCEEGGRQALARDGCWHIALGGLSRELVVLAAPLDYFQANIEAIWYSVPVTFQRGITKSSRHY